jgi:hypothetical protein
MWRMNTISSINDCWSAHLNEYRATIIFPKKWLLDPVNLLLMNMICIVMMKNSSWLKYWLNQHPDEEIFQNAYGLSHGSNWIHRVNHQTTWGMLIQRLMITIPTQEDLQHILVTRYHDLVAFTPSHAQQVCRSL